MDTNLENWANLISPLPGFAGGFVSSGAFSLAGLFAWFLCVSVCTPFWFWPFVMSNAKIVTTMNYRNTRELTPIVEALVKTYGFVTRQAQSGSGDKVFTVTNNGNIINFCVKRSQDGKKFVNWAKVMFSDKAKHTNFLSAVGFSG